MKEEYESVSNEDILDLIIKYVKEHGYPPTIDEIGSMAGFRSKNTTWNRIQRMLNDGMLETDCKGSARAIRIPGYEFVKSRPVKEKRGEVNG